MSRFTFKFWRAAGKAVLALSLAIPMLVTSCEKYDDSLLQQEISEINEEIAKINDRIDKLEARLESEVEALTQMVDGKVTVASCTKDEDGSTVLTLSDGKTITVYPQVPDMTGVSFLSVIEENGVFYWATATVDGSLQALLVDGKKVPVSVKPELKIENGKWFITVDGGQTWIDTGIEEEEEVVVFFSNVTEDDDYVYLTLVSGTTIKVAKDKEVVFRASFGKQYFAYGETKSLALEMVGVKNYTVTEKPDGWKVSIKEKKISITAPAEDNASADAAGVIKVLATFDGTSPIIVSISVSTEEADFVLSLTGDQVTFTLAEKNIGSWNYSGYVYGALPKSSFTPAAAIEYFNQNFTYGALAYDSATVPVSSIVGDGFDPDETYVIFASNFAASYWGESYSEEELQYMEYAPIKINVEITPALDNAYLKLSFSGCDAVYAGFSYADYYSAEDILWSIGSSWGAPTPVTEAYDGPVGLIAGGYDSYLQIGTEYVFWLVIKKDSGEYTTEDVKEYRFSTFGLTLGGSLKAPEISVSSVTMSEVAASVNAVEGCYKTYAYIFTKADASALSEDELVKRTISYGQSAQSGTIEIKKTYLDPGTEVVVCALALDEKGNVGSIAKTEAKTKDLVFDENLSVSIESVSVTATSAKVKFAFKGNVATIKYVNQTSTWGLETMESKLALGSIYASPIEVSTLTDNTLELTSLSLGTTYYFCVMAYDADGNFSHMAQTTFVPESDIIFIKQSNETWSYGKPSLSDEVWGDGAWSNWGGSWYPGSTTLDMTITMPAECKKAYIWARDPEYISLDTELTLSDKIVAYGTVCESSGTVRISEYMNSYAHIYVVWVDDNGKYHTYFEYTPTFPAKPSDSE